MKGLNLNQNSTLSIVMRAIFSLGVGARFMSKDIVEIVKDEKNGTITSLDVALAIKKTDGEYVRIVTNDKNAHIYEVIKVVQ